MLYKLCKQTSSVCHASIYATTGHHEAQICTDDNKGERNRKDIARNILGHVVHAKVDMYCILYALGFL